MKSVLDYHSRQFSSIRKVACWLSVILLAVTAFFIYVSQVEIDNATEETYAVVNRLRLIFTCIAPVALLVIMTYVVLFFKERKEKRALGGRRKANIHLFDVINTSWMVAFCIMCIFPIIYVVAGSFSQGADYAKGGIYLLPRVFTFENYKLVLSDAAFYKSYMVTIARTAIGTVTGLIFTSAVAYAMSRNNLKFKRFFYWANIVTMFFGGGLVPYFLIIQATGLYDTFWVYIIPSLYSVYNMIVISSFFRGISGEIHEAAEIDGAGELYIWWNIYMPLSKPVLATVALWLAVGHWNSYFDTMLYTSSDELQTLQHFLLKAISTSTMTEGLPETMMQSVSAMTVSLAAIILSIIPVLFAFPFVRKNFQSGIMIGSLKG